MATRPTEVEAWLDLQSCADHLDSIRHPRNLRAAMIKHLSKSWDMSNPVVDFGDLGNLWVDHSCRQLVTKLAKCSVTREIWNAATFRKMKICRLQGHWDFLLENAAEWLDMVFQAGEWHVSLVDYQRILNCITPNGEFDSAKLKLLFWTGPDTSEAGNRTANFLDQLPMRAYSMAYDLIESNPPDAKWNLPKIMQEILEQSIHAKALMLHICTWFDPSILEPGSNASQKPPLIEHLKATFSSYGEWKPKALALQETVLSLLAANWDQFRLLSISRYFVLLPPQRYDRNCQNPIWRALVSDIRSSIDVPFRHPDLLQFNVPTVVLPGGDETVRQVLRKPSRRNTASKTIVEFEGMEQDDLTEDDLHIFDRPLPPQVKLSGTRQLSHTDSDLSSSTNGLSVGSRENYIALQQELLADDESSDEDYSPSSSTRVVKLPAAKPQKTGRQRVTKSQTSSQRAPATSPQQGMGPSVSAVSKEMSPGPPTVPAASANGVSSSPMPSNSRTSRRRLSNAELGSTVSRKHRRLHNLPSPSEPVMYAGPVQPASSHDRPSEPARNLLVPVTHSPVARTKVEEAVCILQEHYSERLSIRDMLTAIKILRNEVDAGIFLVLKSGELRKAWLYEEIQQMS